jgi:hypothetical protein
MTKKNLLPLKRILDILERTSTYPGRRLRPLDPAGKKRERRRILQESSGNRWKWKQYSDRKFIGFFPVDFCQFPVLSCRNRPVIFDLG